MIAFINTFLSYLLLFVIMAAIAGVGIFAGTTLSKRKNIKATQEKGSEEE